MRVSLPDALVANGIQLQYQCAFPSDVISRYLIHPKGRAFAGYARVVTVQMGKEARADIATADVHPPVGFIQPVDAVLTGVESFDAGPVECLWGLLRKSHSSSLHTDGVRPIYRIERHIVTNPPVPKGVEPVAENG